MKTHTALSVVLFGASVLLPPPLRAETLRTVESSRLVVSDVAKSRDYGDVDLGPAPPPGSSRLLERREVVQRIEESGGSAVGLEMPLAVRVARSAKRLSTADLERTAGPIVLSLLSAGVKLQSLRFSRGVVVAPRAAMKMTVVPKLPHKAGAMRTTLVFEFVEDGEVVARATATAVLDIDERAARPAVTRGSRVDLVIEAGAARVSAVGSALGDGDIGDVIPVRVESTQKVLGARIESSTSARVVKP